MIKMYTIAKITSAMYSFNEVQNVIVILFLVDQNLRPNEIIKIKFESQLNRLE